MEQLRYNALLNPPDGRLPIPDALRDLHRARVKIWDFFGAAEWTPGDWNVNAVGTGAAALVATNGAAINAPMLQLTASVATDGYTAVHNAKYLALPQLALAHHFYLAFDICSGTNATSAHRAFGLATGTAAQAFDVNTGALFSAGQGMAWSSVNNGAWNFTYKPAGKAALVIPGPTSSGVVSTGFYRVGFLYVGNPTSDALAIGKLYPFAYSLGSASPFQGDDTDDIDAALPGGYFPSPQGMPLENTAHGDTGGAAAGIFIGHGTEAAGARSTYIRRIVAVDNMRR